MYGSINFRKGERRWRDIAEDMDKFEPNWDAAMQYLREGHAYWLRSWENLPASDLEMDVPHHSGKLRPAWRMIQTVVDHDGYHADQISMLRYAVSESDSHPPSSADDVRRSCVNLPNW